MFAPKSMRNIEEIMSEFDEGKKLSPEEERLADSIVFEKTGKRTSKFRTVKKPVEALSLNKTLSREVAAIPIVSETITKSPESDSKTLKKL